MRRKRAGRRAGRAAPRQARWRCRSSGRRPRAVAMATTTTTDGDGGKLLFFASDGLRQDAVEEYAKGTPGFRELLRNGTKASDHGLLTQAPPNTGAGWFTLVTGAWPGVAGSTNNTFHINGQPFGNSTSALGAPNVLQAETLAQAAERGGKKVAQIEWAGGRSGAINGPTLDFRNFRSGRGVATNYIAPEDSRVLHALLRAAVRPSRAGSPATRRSRRPRPRTRPAGRTCRAPTAPPRRCACACIDAGTSTSTASTRTSTTPRTTARRAMTACSSAARSRGADSGRRPARGRVGRRQGQDRHDDRRAQRQDRRVPDQGRAPGPRPLARPPLPHERHARDRDLAELDRRAGLHRHVRGLRRRALRVLAGRRLRRARGRHRERGDLHRAG